MKSENQLITLTTDFCDAFATSQLRAVLYSYGYTGHIIENHDVHPYSIIEGAYAINQISQYCPQNTIHVGVVDPGVGSKREGIIIKTSKNWFVGPNNGLLAFPAINDGIDSVWHIDENKLGQTISNTFHGRDVFIRVAFFLSQNQTPASFGAKTIDTNKVKRLEFVNNQVIHIDHYGNLKVYQKQLKKLQFVSLKNLIFPFVTTFSEVPLYQPLAYIGSSNTLELALNQESLAKKLKVDVGDVLPLNCA